MHFKYLLNIRSFLVYLSEIYPIAKQRVWGFLHRKIQVGWILYALGIFFMGVGIVVGLQVGSKPKGEHLLDLGEQDLSRLPQSIFEPIQRNSKSNSLFHSNRSKNLYSVVTETIREVTAYNVGDPLQTFGNPCESASGENICAALNAGHKRCAANFVPLGTMIKIAEFGVCKVTDRMNIRYKNRVDIAMKKHEKKKALKFGIQKLNVQILKVNI